MFKRITKILGLFAFVCLVTVLVSSVASAYYLIDTIAEDSTGGNSFATCVFGYMPTASTIEHTPSVATACQVSALNDSAAPGQLLFRDLRSVSTGMWSLLVHAGTDYQEDSLVLKLWTLADHSPEHLWDTYQAGTAVLRVVYDPFGNYVLGQILWQGAIGAETTEENPSLEVELYANKTSVPLEEGLYLEFGAIPEPSVLIATVFGLSGIVLFRRRA